MNRELRASTWRVMRWPDDFQPIPPLFAALLLFKARFLNSSRSFLQQDFIYLNEERTSISLKGLEIRLSKVAKFILTINSPSDPCRAPSSIGLANIHKAKVETSYEKQK